MVVFHFSDGPFFLYIAWNGVTARHDRLQGVFMVADH